MGVVMKAAQAKLTREDGGRQSAERKSEVSTRMTPPETEKKFRSYVPEKTDDAGVHASARSCWAW